jgi:dihydroorotase
MILHNGKVYTMGGFVEAGMAINNGRIIKVAKKTNLPTAATKIDLNGNFVLPGLIDSHVHLRAQQLAYKEEFQSGTGAAASGGITTVVDMPNNQPLTMSVETLKERMRLAESRILVNVAFNSALPTEAGDIGRIVDAGAVGFKLYLNQQLGGVNVNDDKALNSAFKVVSQTKVPIAIHAEDESTIEKTKSNLMEQGRRDLNAFLEAHTPEAEEKAINRAARLTKNSGAHIHICHVSSAIGLRAVLEAKKTGCDITCEVTPHHLFLTAQHLRKYGSLALELPPLRTRRDSTYLWQALEKSLIDTIGSDHAPHSLEEKQTESIWDVKPGIVGLETMLPLLLTEVNNGRLKIEQLVRLTCEKPAEIFHLNGRGYLNTNYFADVTVIDLKKEYRIDASKFHSKAKFSPFDGWKVKGKVVKSFVNGQLVMDDGEILATPGIGQIIK